ncbi:MAG: hypothetical protein QG573_1696 [Acidobacteriota bacterium]|nr:hypothetical protein [Acidobacteriota bacterium]
MRTVPVRLGELLEKRGEVTREQLLRALRNQKVLGGRLGTCLLEIEALSEEQLCSALAEQQGVPSASPEDLRGIPDDVLHLLPAKLAKRCHAIAFQASATQVKVALIDARNLAHQDEISFVVRRRIRWYVAPELRLIEALEKHHGEECPARLSKLLDRMNRSRFLWARENAAAAAADRTPRPTGEQLQWDSRIAGVAAQEPSPAPATESPESVSLELPHFQHQTLDLPTLAPMPPTSPTPPTPPVAPPAPAAAASLPVPAEASQIVPSPGPAILPAPVPARTGTPGASPGATEPAPPADAPPRRISVEETETRLLRPRERDDVARAVVDFATGLVARVVLFVVRKDGVATWLWSGDGLDAVRLAAWRLRPQQPSLFDGLKEEGGFFRGPLSPLPAHASLAACFTAPAISGDVFVLPLKVKERLVAALLFEPRSVAGAELAPAEIADLQRVIAKAEIGFELCIMQAKLRQA